MRSTGIHHVDLVVSDLEQSLAFYRELLVPLGWHGVSHTPGERGETIHYLYGPGSTIGLRQAPGPAAGLPVDRYRIGLHHLCLEAASREALEDAAARLRRLGATITDGPREFPEYRPGYHAVFFLDPDGLKLELVWTPPGTYDYQRAPQGAGSAQYSVASKNQRAMSSCGSARPPIQRLMIFESRQCFSTSDSRAYPYEPIRSITWFTTFVS